MAEWNAYYRNEDDDEGQDEGEEAAGEIRAEASASCHRSLKHLACMSLRCQTNTF